MTERQQPPHDPIGTLTATMRRLTTPHRAGEPINIHVVPYQPYPPTDYERWRR